MKLYLIEKYSSDIGFEVGSTIVALTPLACYQLDKEGIEYTIWEDYVDIPGIIDQYQEYDECLKQWLEEFDRFIFKIIPKAALFKLPLATVYSNHWRNVIDSMILRAKELQAVFQSLEPSHVVYISSDHPDDSIDYRIFFRGDIESLFSRLAPSICAKLQIDFRRIFVPRVEKKRGQHIFSLKQSFRFYKFRSSIASIKLVKMLWNDIKIFISCIGQAGSEKQEKMRPDASILFLQQNQFLGRAMAEAVKNGYKVYYKSGDSIVRQYCGFHSLQYRLGMAAQLQDLGDDILIKKLNQETDLIARLSQLCGVDVAPIISSRLLYFVKSICAKLVSCAEDYGKIFDDMDCKLVLLSNAEDLTEFAAIATCRYLGKAKTIFVNHGDGVFDMRYVWRYYLSQFDLFVVSSQELCEWLESQKNSEHLGIKIEQSNLRYSGLPRIRKSQEFPVKARPCVVYVPTMLQWDANFWTTWWPDTWYYKWQKQLLNYFGERVDCDFIWKEISHSDGTYNPIIDLIRDRNYSNVCCDGRPFPGWLAKADRVLMDYPSTALYESAFANVPAMSLYFEPYCRVRKTAVEMFSKSLQPFSGVDEGIRKVSAFLDADASQFIAGIPRSNPPFIDLINGIYDKSKFS